jgi:hypothetical protein
LNDRRNATSSWSGYLHQGKVGILLALRELHKCILSNEDISLYKLEYESAEDIDIKKQDIILSRHQVKAYKNAQYPNDYIDVLNEQKYERINSELTLVQKGFQIHKYDTQGNVLCEEVDENSRYLHTNQKYAVLIFLKKNL